MKTQIAVGLLFVLTLACWPVLTTTAQDPGPLFKPESFLVVPFAKETSLTITEGWDYTDEESAIHGYKRHYAVDFAAACGTPVYAAAEGFAYCSFMTLTLEPPRFYQGKRVGVGLGHFVEIIHSNGLRTQYGHLQKVAEGIPYHEPVPKDDGSLYPQVVHSPVEELKSSGKSVQVKQGDLIGWVGDSGLTWGYIETPTSRPHPKEYPSWDEFHLHFEVYDRNDRGLKRNRFDPFGIYGHTPAYQTWKSTERGLWLLNQDGQTRFAR